MKTFKNRWLIFTILTFVIAACGGGNDSGSGSKTPKPPGSFLEGWGSASNGVYVPADATFISSDEGQWFVGDTVSAFPECGATPQEAEIFNNGGNNTLRLTSKQSGGECTDNVWVALANFGLGKNTGFSIPISSNTTISFDETGSLISPQMGFRRCGFPPCYDVVALLLEDSNGNILAYVFQRPTAADPNESTGDYLEIFLDPDAGSYSRNLFDDYMLIADFNPNGAEIISIEFQISEHGTATFDNLFIGEK